jgi:uncharacterized protein (DUF427 family)
MTPITRIAPGPGQESVWDYPRPPRLEPVAARIRVELGGVVIADSPRTHRVLETSHPPTYYIPLSDVLPEAAVAIAARSFCEWKGEAVYYDLRGGERVARAAAWGYPSPSAGFDAIGNCIAVYAGRVDACWVGEERVTPQPGGFYGGWVTSGVVGPFKGGPGTAGW